MFLVYFSVWRKFASAVFYKLQKTKQKWNQQQQNKQHGCKMDLNIKNLDIWNVQITQFKK